MATPRKPKAEPRAVGAPVTKHFKPEYCQMLVDHMRQGYGFQAFGAIADCSYDTLRKWEAQYVEFAQARKQGESYLHRFYTDMGRLIATGQLRRVTSETPIMGHDGKPALDPTTGQVLMKREYEPTQGNATAWIFLTKNLLGWRNENHLAITQEPAAQRSRAADLTPDERMKEVGEMMTFLKEVNADLAQPVIDVTPGKEIA
jgi:hypothetical protein